ncbi:nuclear transport factor 2 family protein [Teredinibacter purpureus]|nr:nuclear transport factor 2 family protein [Teredinibacter purpureus]
MSERPPINEFPVVESFKGFYRDISKLRLDDMASLYDGNIVFRDPIHEVRGLDDLHAYMGGVCANVEQGRFEYLDQLVGNGCAYIKWNMYFTHPKLGRNTIAVRGISHIEFGERIYYHEDVYDMGEMLYEHLPLIGQATRWLKGRISGSVR